MAIANGTCVSFCNQPNAHFGLPWIRPWNNRDKCHTDGKRIKCSSKALQHVSIYLQPFPSNSTLSSKVRHFSTFLHILASLGYAYGTIAVTLHGLKENSMLVKCIAAYTHLSSTVYEQYSEILVGNCNFFLLLAFNAPVGRDSLGRCS